MSFLWELVGEVLLWFSSTFLFLTGEILLKAVTLGKYRIRWKEPVDLGPSIGPILLGVAFWVGIGALLYRLFL